MCCDICCSRMCDDSVLDVNLKHVVRMWTIMIMWSQFERKIIYQELEFKSLLLLVLYCSMYIIRYILASCKFDQHKLDNGSSILIANLTSAKGA